MPYRPQKFHCRSKIPFLGICRGEPYLANKISGIHLGRKKKTCIFLARGKVQNHGIYSSRRPPPLRNSIAARFGFWVFSRGKSSKTRGWSSQRSYAVWFLIYVYPIDISSRLKSPPTSLGSPQQKMWGGVYFMWSGEIITVQIFLVLPPIFQS